MKNLFGIMLLSTTVFWACQNNRDLAHPQTTETSREQKASSGNHALHSEFIHNYRQSKVFSRSEYYSIQDALDIINYGLNSLYCRPNTKLFERTYSFFDTVSVAVNVSSEIYEDDIANAMDDIAEFAGGIFHNRTVEDTSKASWIFNVVDVSEPVGGYVDLAAMYILQEGEPITEEDAFPYEESWPWFYNEQEEETAECAEDNIAAGAEDLFRRDMRKALTYIKPKTDPPFILLNLKVVAFGSTSENSVGGYELPFFDAALIDDVYTLDELEDPEDETAQDNYFDHYSWSNQTNYSNFHECLTVNEMNFHYQEVRDLLVAKQPYGTDIIASVEVGYFYNLLGYTLDNHIIHGWYADKEVLYMGNEEPEILPIGN